MAFTNTPEVFCLVWFVYVLVFFFPLSVYSQTRKPQVTSGIKPLSIQIKKKKVSVFRPRRTFFVRVSRSGAPKMFYWRWPKWLDFCFSPYFSKKFKFSAQIHFPGGFSIRLVFPMFRKKGLLCRGMCQAVLRLHRSLAPFELGLTVTHP